MRILFVCSSPPLSPTNGASIRTFHFIRRFSKTHAVGVWALGDPRPAPPDLAYYAREPMPASGAWRLRLRGLTGYDPLSRWGFDAGRLAGSISRAIGEFSPDIVFFEGLATAVPILSMTASASRPFLIFDPSDAVHVILRRALQAAGGPKAWRPKSWLEAWFIRAVERMERRVAAAADLCLCVSGADAAALDLARIAKRHRVVPNGADTDYFQPLPDAAGSKEVVFAGSLSYGPNYDAVRYYAEDIHPRVLAARPDARLIVVGKVPPELEALRGKAGLEFAGFQEDVRPFFRRAAASVVPLRSGSGTRFKILESWAMGRAVVSTTIGAEGLPGADRANMLIADDPASFAKAVVELLDDAALRRTLALSGRRTVEEGFRWDSVAGALEHHLESLMKEAK